MKTLLVLSAALLTVGCVPRVPVRFTPRVSTVPKINTVPKFNPATMPKPIVTPHPPQRMTMPIELNRPLARPTTAKDKGRSIVDSLGGDLPVDQIIGGSSDDRDKERKRTATPPRLPR